MPFPIRWPQPRIPLKQARSVLGYMFDEESFRIHHLIVTEGHLQVVMWGVQGVAQGEVMGMLHEILQTEEMSEGTV